MNENLCSIIMYSSAFSREGLPVIDRRDAGISRREREMYDMIHEELLDAVGIEDREWLTADDIHPYKSLVPKSKSNTVSFPKITKFNTYLLQHYGAEIVGELNEMIWTNQQAEAMLVPEGNTAISALPPYSGVPLCLRSRGTHYRGAFLLGVAPVRYDLHELLSGRTVKSLPQRSNPPGVRRCCLA